jgi:hypothetical protein
MNKSFPENFQKVVDWLNNRGIQVLIGRDTHYSGYMKRIIIHHNFNLDKNGLYSLLHEAGHSLQPVTPTGANLYKSIDDLEKPRLFAMYQFINEQDAWDRALIIADQLDIPIDMKAFNKIKQESLLTYFKVKS